MLLKQLQVFLDALYELVGSGVDDDLVAVVYEVSNLKSEAGACKSCGLGYTAGGIAAYGRLGVLNGTGDVDGKLNGDGAALIQGNLADILHAVNDIVDSVTEVLLLDVVLAVVGGVHEDIQRVVEVGEGGLLPLEDDVLKLVVSLEYQLGAGSLEKVLELHLDGGCVAAGLVELGLENDHGIFAEHDYVAGTYFLGDFHR